MPRERTAVTPHYYRKYIIFIMSDPSTHRFKQYYTLLIAILNVFIYFYIFYKLEIFEIVKSPLEIGFG